MSRPRIGLRTQLVWPLALLLALTVALSLWSVWQASEQVKANADAELATLMSTLTRPPSFPLTDAVLGKMKSLTGCEFLLVRTGGTSSGTATSTDLPESTVYRYTSFDFPESHPNFGSKLWVGYPTSRWRERQLEAIRAPMIFGVAVVVAILVLILLSSRIVNRVHQLKEQAETMLHDGEGSAPTEVNDELGDLQRAVTETSTRLRSYQKQLQETERLRVLGQFSGGLAHQLRNAATAAKLSVQLSMQETPPDKEALLVALRQMQRMESMLQQFLQVGKPVSDNTMSLLNLSDVAQQAMEGYAAQAKHLGISLTVDCQRNDDRPGQALALCHLVGNLLGNAIDAAGPGGAVELRCVRNVLEVIDSGSGPSESVQTKLFEAFVTSKPQGIGLGLAVAKQVAEAHGTVVEWFRRDGRTVFRVNFSLADSTVDPARPRS